MSPRTLKTGRAGRGALDPRARAQAAHGPRNSPMIYKGLAALRKGGKGGQRTGARRRGRQEGGGVEERERSGAGRRRG